MEQAAIIGTDISKKGFQPHGATAEGEPVFRRTLSRDRFPAFLSEAPSCPVVTEACGGGRRWGRAVIDLGHGCRLIPPVCVKPEAARSDSMPFRARALPVRQRARKIDSLRGHPAGSGVAAPLGPGGVGKPRREPEAVREPLPGQAASMATPPFSRTAALSGQAAGLDREIRVRARERAEMKRLMTVPGAGPVRAMAVHAFAPPMEGFRSGRGFAAWAGLAPRRRSTGDGRGPAGSRRRAAGSRRRGGAASGSCLSWALRPCSGMRAGARNRMIPGSGGCWRRSRRSWLPSLLRTGWRASSGRCRPGRKPAGRQRRPAR